MQKQIDKISPSDDIPEDFGEQVLPQQEKQIPGPSYELPSYSEDPPEYEQGPYLKMKEQEVLKRYGLPIFTSIPENKEEIEKAYTAKLKPLGPAKANITREINKIKKEGDSSDKEKLEKLVKQRQKLEIESGIIMRKRDILKKR